MKGIWKYNHWLPSIDESSRVTLGEGQTPLIKSRSLGQLLGLENLYFKLENVNPTGSYKDRFAAVAVSDLIASGVKNCFATSSGNTGAALAAYCAASNIHCYVLVVDGAPQGKLQQMLCYGANILMVKEFGKNLEVTAELMERYSQTAESLNSPVQISAYKYSPVGMSGVQTIAYEIAEALSTQELHVFSPAGGGGLTNAVARGFIDCVANDATYAKPRVYCVQPLGNDTISSALREGREHGDVLAHSTTAISGLQVPNVLDGDEVIKLCRNSGGTGITVTDVAISEAQYLLSSKEGIFCEPAGAVTYAGLASAVKMGQIQKDDHVVCLVTGSGFKDPASMTNMAANATYKYFDTINETFEFIHSKV